MDAMAKAKMLSYYKQDYEFTEDMFTDDSKFWRRILSSYKDKDNLNYLEIGTFEGSSFLWVMENLLTGKNCKATVIDPFDPNRKSNYDFEAVFRANLAKLQTEAQITVLKGLSQNHLMTLQPKSMDLIFIDGCHRTFDALTDYYMSFQLLKKGGVIVIDDCNLFNDMPYELNLKQSMDIILRSSRSLIEVMGYTEKQLFIKKVRESEELKSFDLSYGRDSFDWETKWLNDDESRPLQGEKLVEIEKTILGFDEKETTDLLYEKTYPVPFLWG